MENIKIKIPSPEISKKVQEKAFKLGHTCLASGSVVFDSLYLFLYNNGRMGRDNSEFYFNEHANTEITWQDFLYKDVDINNCKINLKSIPGYARSNLYMILTRLGIVPYGDNSLLPSPDRDFAGIYIKDGKTTTIGTDFYYNIITLPELSIDYILENYKEKEMEVLPEKWCIKVTEENCNILGKFYSTHAWEGYERYIPKHIGKYYTSHNLVSDNSVFSDDPGSNFRLIRLSPKFSEITFDQFKRLVLKQEPQDNKNMNEIELKCIKIPSKAKNIKEGKSYSGIYIDEEETQVDNYKEAVYFLCENDKGTQARYNIDLFEEPVIVKPIITLETLPNYLRFTHTSIKFKDNEYILDLIDNDHRNLLASTTAANSCGIYLLGSQGNDGGVDNLQSQINDAVYDGAWEELKELYEIQANDEDIVFTIFSEYIKWKISVQFAGFFILSTNNESNASISLDKMQCLKTNYVTNPNSQRAIKMWIFSKNMPLDEKPENEDDDFGF